VDEIIDAKDFKIQNLERIIAEKELEIKGLERRLEDVRYFVTLGNERVVKAMRGELEKPTMRERIEQFKFKGDL
jgi:predicted RNase H-like nuclease (RuvC/YqgF family)